MKEACDFVVRLRLADYALNNVAARVIIEDSLALLANERRAMWLRHSSRRDVHSICKCSRKLLKS